jgi:hypothetical protein
VGSPSSLQGFHQLWPFLGLVGSVFLVLFATPLALFFEKAAVIMACISSGLYLVFIFSGVIFGHKWTGRLANLALIILPGVIYLDSYFRLRRLSDTPLFVFRQEPHWMWRVVLLLIPLLLFSNAISAVGEGIATTWTRWRDGYGPFGSKRESRDTFLIAKGYRGKVHILFNQPDGAPEKWEDNRRIFEIPSDGFLATQAKCEWGRLDIRCFTVDSDAKRQSLRWISTKDSSPDEIGVYEFGSWTNTETDGRETDHIQFFVGRASEKG